MIKKYKNRVKFIEISIIFLYIIVQSQYYKMGTEIYDLLL